MDSKLKRITIVSAVLCIFLIIGTVLVLNIVKQNRSSKDADAGHEAGAAQKENVQAQAAAEASVTANAKIDQTDLTDPALYAYREDQTFFDQDHEV